MTSILLISTYELGHQPFGIASPAAWLKDAGAEVMALDLSIESLDSEKVRNAGLIAIYVPMHTATRLAAKLIPNLRKINSQAHLCCFGLYAQTNENYLRQLGVHSIIGGEFETAIADLYRTLETKEAADSSSEIALTSLERQRFLVPERSVLPSLQSYAHLMLPDGETKPAGYTETTRGCKHHCQHCPIVPVYNGRFRIVQREIVLEDIRQQIGEGARHITFGDPDFLNGPGHTIPIVKALHAEYPDITYDVTIKIEHLLAYEQHLPVLKATGCVFITSAVESMDDHILEILRKGHTQNDVRKAVALLKEVEISLNPTFVSFTPWTTPAIYFDMLRKIRELDLVENVSPIQYAIRLLIPAKSRLLDRKDIQDLVEPFDQAALCYPWKHPDKKMDDLYARLFHLVQKQQSNQDSRSSLFYNVWNATLEETGISDAMISHGEGWEMASKPVPRLSESWY
jgi:radical SAM superfamily enzyme YgiQ (UPF0313 family)